MDDFQKFLTLEPEKRERIINAAMTEFLHGFKKASTDNIVREAGISKGLLFHYFGTKERLFNFLIDYAIDTVKAEYLDLVNIYQPDILDSIWQSSLLKKDLSVRFPSIFDFLTNSYVEAKTGVGVATDNLERFTQMSDKIITEIYAHADTSLFRDDIDKKAAMNIIGWTMSGYSHAKIMESGENPGADARENYDQYLEEFEKILGVLRQVFYKKTKVESGEPESINYKLKEVTV
ncbi:MAG: TetR/AcrR family transcriptional regulator [Defluviitaleaceae bacterium]|nr:TetR/AcrR family transcriptional regulator [Defluviitaleaceae bacterium]